MLSFFVFQALTILLSCIIMFTMLNSKIASHFIPSTLTNVTDHNTSAYSCICSLLKAKINGLSLKFHSHSVLFDTIV